MIITSKTPYTLLDIWGPKYSTQYGEIKEWCLLPAQYKVDQGANVIICEITKAKHLLGRKFCIKKRDAQKYPLVPNNGGIMCYEIPLSKFEPYESVNDIKETVRNLGW